MLHDIASRFEALAKQIEHMIETLAADESGSVDLAALHRAKDVAQRGARIARNATSDVRRAFD